MTKVELDSIELAKQKVEEELKNGKAKPHLDPLEFYKTKSNEQKQLEESGSDMDLIDGILSKKNLKDLDASRPQFQRKQQMKQLDGQQPPIQQSRMQLPPSTPPQQQQQQQQSRAFVATPSSQQSAAVPVQANTSSKPVSQAQTIVFGGSDATGPVAGERKLSKEEMEIAAQALQFLVKHRGGGPFGKGRLQGSDVAGLVQTLLDALNMLRSDSGVLPAPSVRSVPDVASRPVAPPYPAFSSVPMEKNVVKPTMPVTKPSSSPPPTSAGIIRAPVLETRPGGTQEVPIALGLNNFLQSPGTTSTEV